MKLYYVEQGTLYVVTAVMRTIMGQVVRANTPVCYSQTGMFKVMCREEGTLSTINWTMLRTLTGEVASLCN